MLRLPFVFVLALSGCPVPTDDSASVEAPVHFSACQASDGRAYTLGSVEDTGTSPVRVDGNTLEVDVSYGGGCEAHEFVICWPDQSFAESDPVQANLEVWHGGVPDNCDAMLSETLQFDLAPLHDAWQSAYGADGGTIRINVAGASESVDYSFDG